jgi:hypothetical protein
MSTGTNVSAPPPIPTVNYWNKIYSSIGSEVFMAVSMKMAVLWVVSCSLLEVY